MRKTGRLKRLTAFLLAMTFMVTMLSAEVNILAGEKGTWYDKVEGIEGGGVQFDKTTGTITFIGKDVTVANIPEKIDGTKVRALGDWSLQDNKNLVKVTFPEGLERLGQGTPKGIYKIRVTVGKTVDNSKTVQTVKIRVK